MISKETQERCVEMYRLGEQIRDIGEILNQKGKKLYDLSNNDVIVLQIDNVQPRLEEHIKNILWTEFEGTIDKKRVTITEE